MSLTDRNGSPSPPAASHSPERRGSASLASLWVATWISSAASSANRRLRVASVPVSAANGRPRASVPRAATSSAVYGSGASARVRVPSGVAVAANAGFPSATMPRACVEGARSVASAVAEGT